MAEFTEAFHEAVDDYVLACKKLGQAPEKPASGRLMLRVNPVVHAAALKAAALKAAALKAAAHTGQSLNRWAEQVLRQASHA